MVNGTWLNGKSQEFLPERLNHREPVFRIVVCHIRVEMVLALRVVNDVIRSNIRVRRARAVL